MWSGWLIEEELLQHSHNPILLLQAELGKDWQTENLATELFGDGQAAWFIPEALIGRLSVDGDWVINDRINSMVLQTLL